MTKKILKRNLSRNLNKTVEAFFYKGKWPHVRSMSGKFLKNTRGDIVFDWGGFVVTDLTTIREIRTISRY